MAIKPILFSTPMVQAIMAGRKTMTRRVAKFPRGCNPSWSGYSPDGGAIYGSNNIPAVKAKYRVGDILWVRETWQDSTEWDGTLGGWIYKASENGEEWERNTEEWKWRPSIFMPKAACRLFLRVTAVRAERLQQITFLDALSEGVNPNCIERDGHIEHAEIATANAIGMQRSAVDAFHALWDSLNAKRGYGWDANPWIWVYTFERCEKPEGWC